MPGEAAKAPPDCRPIVLCLRSGIKRGCDRRTSTGQGAWSTYTSRRLDTYLWRRDRQQSVRWGRAAADKTPRLRLEGARWAGQRRVLLVISGQPDRPAHLRTG